MRRSLVPFRLPPAAVLSLSCNVLNRLLFVVPYSLRKRAAPYGVVLLRSERYYTRKRLCFSSKRGRAPQYREYCHSTFLNDDHIYQASVGYFRVRLPRCGEDWHGYNHRFCSNEDRMLLGDSMFSMMLLHFSQKKPRSLSIRKRGFLMGIICPYHMLRRFQSMPGHS